MSETTTFLTSTPEAQGVSSAGILAFIQALEEKLCGAHGFVLLRHGHKIASGWWHPYGPDYRHMLFSLSKSFTSTAVGLAVSEGRLTLDDPVISLFPAEDLPKHPGKRWPEVKVRHLLSMSSGHLKDTMERLWQRRIFNWTKGILDQAIRCEPGSHFVYNNGATYLLAALVRQVTGENVVDYLKPRLFTPLGIVDPTWESCPRGISCGAWGLSLTTEEIARFGQLYLQKGRWGDRQLLPESWVEQATGIHIYQGGGPESDWSQGYGFQFWHCRHGAYRGDGAFGQFCLVMPEQDAVLAMNSGVQDMQTTLNVIWDDLLPAFQPAALAEDGAAQAALAEKAAGLAFAPQAGAPGSRTAVDVTGRQYSFESNRINLKTMVFDFDARGFRLKVEDNHGSHEMQGKYGDWQFGNSSWTESGDVQRVAVSGGWTAEDTFTVQSCSYETPFFYTMTFRFNGEQLFFKLAMNVNFGPTEFPEMRGKINSI